MWSAQTIYVQYEEKSKKTTPQLFQVHHLPPPEPRETCANTVPYETSVGDQEAG